MANLFCKTCGSLLRPRKTPYGNWMSCPDGHSQPEINQDGTVVIKNTPAKIVEVADDTNLLAVHDHPCKKCGHNKAELLEIMPFYSDEDNTFRMKCGKCGAIEQLEGKTT
ncbi:hypothetical protein HOC13_03130 [Candidatus Woesearchaeota archaeon]|jgi:DNA-directed RNA polymerase subunit M/transcription elongation factor TFIIS|nr:hypothetical protein [Candidatus Woesearchaeota archaeon]